MRWSACNKGAASPRRVIQGPNTQLNWPMGIAIDHERNEIAVANYGTSSILIFRRTDKGDVAPVRGALEKWVGDRAQIEYGSHIPAQRFHTVIIVGIPVMSREMRNEAARFTALIDVLYEHRVKLLAAADAEPAALYPEGDGSFEFQRTASRIEEMRSADYLAQGHGLAA